MLRRVRGARGDRISRPCRSGGSVEAIIILSSRRRNRRRLYAIDNMMAQTVESEFQTIGDTQLVINLAQIILYDLLGRAHADGDFFILHALGYAGNDQRFFGRELNFRARPGRPQVVSAIGFHYPMNGLVLKPWLAGGNLAKTLDQ